MSMRAGSWRRVEIFENHRSEKHHRGYATMAVRVVLGASVFCALLCPALPALGAEATNTTGEATAAAPESSIGVLNEEMLRTYLQLQEQLHATQLAIERNRQSAELSSLQTEQSLQARLQSIEQALAAQRASELEAMQKSNRTMLIVAGSFASIGFVAMVLMAVMVFFQWRAMNRLAEISGVRALGAGAPTAALAGDERSLLTMGPAEGSNARLRGAIEQLERRIHELEHTTRPVLNATPSGENGRGTDSLLSKGQSLLEADKAQEALSCFERLLEEQPKQPEVLVKRGMALEKLGKLDEAVESYDAAIAANGSLTVAYLHKGGVFNRMQRFSEALECYEQALRTQEKPGI